MSRRVLIDCLAFGSEGGSLQGELEVAALTRLHDSLSDFGGCLAYRIRGAIGERKRPELRVEVDGDLSLRCQRCLEVLPYRVELRSLLEFVDSDSDLTQEELEDDSRDYLPVQKALDVAGLIEDELILALPSVPRHTDCALPGAAREDLNLSPFSVLAGLQGRLQ